MMRVYRKSPLTGKVNCMDLDITEAQIQEWDHPNRRMVQEIFPNLSDTEREFLMTGYTQEDWDKMFPKEDEYEA